MFLANHRAQIYDGIGLACLVMNLTGQRDNSRIPYSSGIEAFSPGSNRAFFECISHICMQKEVLLALNSFNSEKLHKHFSDPGLNASHKEHVGSGRVKQAQPEIFTMVKRKERKKQNVTATKAPVSADAVTSTGCVRVSE